MIGHTQRPLLFLDVDGPLLPFGDGPQHPPPGGDAPTSHLARLDPQMGPRLAALPCELVWATTWEQEANTEIAPRLGLPQLPVVNWPEPSDEHERENQWFGLHWKTRTVVAWARGRPFAWIDDEITDADRDWVSAHHRGRAPCTTSPPPEDSPMTTSRPSANGYAQHKLPMDPQDLTITRGRCR